MFQRIHRKQRILFGLWDVIWVAVAFFAAYQTRLELELERNFAIAGPIQVLLLGVSMVLWVTLGNWLGIYERSDRARVADLLRRTLQQCGLGAVGIIVLEYTLRLDLSRSFLALFVGYSFLLLALFRSRAGWVLGRWRRDFAAPQYVLLIGTGERAQRIGQIVESSAGYGLRLVGFLSAEPGQAQGRLQLEREYDVHPLETLPALLQQHVVDEVIFAVESDRLAALEDAFLLCEEEGVRTRVSVDVFPHVNSRVYLDRLSEAPLLTFSATPHDEVRLMLKRLTDIAIAGPALLLSLPFIALVALLIRLTSPGPVIFRQVRCGLNGRRFTVYKFRTMVQDAERLKGALEHLNRKRVNFKIPNDPRLTPLGKWLRKFSIDEWPQLWNVLRGDMSLVGPRPPIPTEVEQYQRWQRRRLRMRPGLTCLWALNGRDQLDFEDCMRMDMEYIDNWSLTLDCKILLRTIPEVVLGRGAH